MNLPCAVLPRRRRSSPTGLFELLLGWLDDDHRVVGTAVLFVPDDARRQQVPSSMGLKGQTSIGRIPPRAMDKPLMEQLASVGGFTIPAGVACPASGCLTACTERTTTTVRVGGAAQFTRDRRGDRPSRSAISTRSTCARNRELTSRTANRPSTAMNATPLTVALGLVAAGPAVPGGPRDTVLARRGQNAPPTSRQLHEPLTLRRLRTMLRPRCHTTRRRQHNLPIQAGVWQPSALCVN